MGFRSYSSLNDNRQNNFDRKLLNWYIKISKKWVIKYKETVKFKMGLSNFIMLPLK